MPPHLAGREAERLAFHKLLGQTTILENAILTGLRGVGKTVLLDTLKPEAVDGGWKWVGTDFSESSSISEERMCLRLITDLSVVTSNIVIHEDRIEGIGFRPTVQLERRTLDFETLDELYQNTPGLASDKIKKVLEVAWSCLNAVGVRGVIFAYDEAQNLSDHAKKDEYPLSLLLDVFQSIQKMGIPFMIVMAGLPTLFPKLVEARTFAERMFHVIFLDRLNEEESRDAIVTPMEKSEHCPEKLDSQTVESCIELSGGYPYFIQFICREVVDAFLQQQRNGETDPTIPIREITRKLDADFFAGRWARATDRQRELLTVIAHLESSSGEFSVQEVVVKSKEILEKPFSASHANQMLAALSKAGLVYKNRHGRYSFAVPLLDRFILRQEEEIEKRQGRLFE